MSHKPSIKQLHQAQVTKYNNLLMQREEMETEINTTVSKTLAAAKKQDFEHVEILRDLYTWQTKRLELVNIKIGECMV